ncbi:MAG: SDR family oxidoreductase [Halioglobus sp.]|nr:SDR family oxidoreductase [Halioglobus sp.]
MNAGASKEEVAVIVGGGPGVSASCARRFRREGIRVVVAARNPDKPALVELEKECGVICRPCDATNADSVAGLFDSVEQEFGTPQLVVHNIDGRFAEIFRKDITDADPSHVAKVFENSALSAFLVGQHAARCMLERDIPEGGQRGTILYTNASAALKGFPRSAAFAMACQAKKGLAQSMARELGPKGIHVAQIPIDSPIGNTLEDGSRAHWLGGPTEEDNMADPDQIAEAYLYLHRQHRSTWAFEIVLRPWKEVW